MHSAILQRYELGPWHPGNEHFWLKKKLFKTIRTYSNKLIYKPIWTLSNSIRLIWTFKSKIKITQNIHFISEMSRQSGRAFSISHDLSWQRRWNTLRVARVRFRANTPERSSTLKRRSCWTFRKKHLKTNLKTIFYLFWIGFCHWIYFSLFFGRFLLFKIRFSGDRTAIQVMRSAGCKF